MNFDRKSRGQSLASKNPSKFIKKQFIQYEPELANELTEKKSKNQSVSGRLLTLLYKRLSFWSRYAKHQYQGRRYFWKSISELSEELCYSTKQVARGLKSLEELGMIKREKLNKHNWKHTYYYYLPHSVHTAEPEASTSTRTTSSNGTRFSSSNSTSGGSEPVGTPLRQSSTHSTHPHHNSTRTTPVGTEPRSVGTGGSGGGSHRAEPLKPFRQRQSGQNVSFISTKNNPLLENQLRQVVEKCLDYGINPPNTLTGGGLGFAT